MGRVRKLSVYSVVDSAERLQTAVENHAIGIFETDPASGVVYWSTELERIFGYDPGEFNGSLSTWRAHVFPADLSRVDKAFVKAIANKACSMRYNYRMHRCDGANRHIEASVRFYYDEAGNHTRRIGVNVDVTDRIAQGARLRLLFDQMHEGFIAFELVYDETGIPIDFRFLEANRSVRKLSGLPSDVIGKRAYELLPGLEKFWLQTYTQIVETGNPATFTHYAAPLGRWFHVHAYKYAENCFAALFLDITKQKKVEAEGRKAQRASLKASRLTAMGAMASTLAHELNQPLAAAANHLAVIQRMMGHNTESNLAIIREATEGALAANARAGEIINRIRSFTLEGHVEKSHEDLRQIIAAASETLNEFQEINILLNIDLHQKSLQVHASKVQMEQVFSNLFRNAATAMQERPAPREIIVRSRKDKAFMEVRVKDTGPGLSKEQIEHIFEPFQSTTHGAGLGLAICRTIIEAHGGSIRANSAEGHGAEFIIRLPSSKD